MSKLLNPRWFVTAAALLCTLGGAWGVIATVDSRYAKAEDLQLVSERQERHEIVVRMKALQERMWAMEDYWGEKFAQEKARLHDSLEELLAFMTKEARGQYRALQTEYAELQARLDKLDEKES